jgi:hypothetical protein
MSAGTGNDAVGLMYQWGRKDPFPGPSDVQVLSASEKPRTWYDENGTFTLLSVKGTASGDIRNAVGNPLTRYYNGSDWFTGSRLEDLSYNYFWGASVDNTDPPAKVAFVSSTGKSVYDPCPEGWKVPRGKATRNTAIPTESPWPLDLNTSITGEYPRSGFMESTKTAYANNGVTTGRYWTATPMDALNNKSPYTSASHGGLSMSNKKPEMELFPGTRADLCAVRCVKEVE